MAYTSLEKYYGNQIILGKLDYSIVVTVKPQFKSGIDEYLTEQGRTDLITQ